MVNEEMLSAVLSEFAWTLSTDFPIQGILDHLVERIVDVLPVTAAGVTLISSTRMPRYVAASDASALRYEQLQSELGQGPCLSAYLTGEPVSVPDLGSDGRYPQFAPVAVDAGLAAVFTFPLRHGDGRFGALDLYRDAPGALNARDMEVAQTLANVTAAYLLNAQARDDAQANSKHYQHIALHDGLTGLPNRRLLQERLRHAAQRARRSHSNAAVLFVDLDRFKSVNDTHGHHVGDELLLAVAKRLSFLVRAGDTLARVAGDEFVFLCEDLADPADADLIAQRVDRAFAEPFFAAGVELRVTASVGMAFAGPTEIISDQLVDKADMAMYQAKRRGGACYQVTGVAVGPPAGAVLEQDLRWAFSHDQLDIAYQPIVRTSDGAVTGVEALLRWDHPDRGPVPAPTVIKIAEQSGLIVDIGAWILQRSCRERARWMSLRSGTPWDIAVNVSAKQLLDVDFAPSVARVLDATGTDPAALILEVTESLLIEETEKAVAALDHLKSLGIRLALDDFGSGYSSLSYLSRLPIDIVKIDRGFISDLGSISDLGGSDIGRATPGGAIAAAVTDLAHSLGLSVVAEGVETQVQSDGVRAIGCDFAQGYFYARPMPASEMERVGSRFPAES